MLGRQGPGIAIANRTPGPQSSSSDRSTAGRSSSPQVHIAHQLLIASHTSATLQRGGVGHHCSSIASHASTTLQRGGVSHHHAMSTADVSSRRGAGTLCQGRAQPDLVGQRRAHHWLGKACPGTPAAYPVTSDRYPQVGAQWHASCRSVSASASSSHRRWGASPLQARSSSQRGARAAEHIDASSNLMNSVKTVYN